MSDVNNSIFKRRIATVAIIVILCHLMLSFLYALPREQFKIDTPLRAFYTKLVLLGPFFMESRIGVSQHLYVSGKKGANWSKPRDIVSELRRTYMLQPWKYDALITANLTRKLSRETSKQLKRSGDQELLSHEELIRLHYLVTKKFFPNPDFDSMKLVSIVKRGVAGTKTIKIDTSFNVTYSTKMVPLDK